MRHLALYPLMLGTVLLSACNPFSDESRDARVQSKAFVIKTGTATQTPIFPKSKTIDDIDFGQYSRGLASFTDLKHGQSRIAAIDIVRLLFAPEQGANIIKTASSTFELEGGSVMLLSADGFADDSVRAQEFYLIFEGEKGAQKLADFGTRIKCWRGENTTDWQTELCP